MPILAGDGPAHPENEGWEVRDGEDAEEGRYPPGEHPLEGVPDLEDLAEPEPLSAKVDLSEVSDLLACGPNLVQGGPWGWGFWLHSCPNALAVARWHAGHKSI